MSNSRQDLTITIKARVDGYETEICYTGSIEALLAVTRRLRELGAEPTITPRRGPSTPTTPVEYDDDGDACCPVHHRKLDRRPWGLTCSARAVDGQQANKNGFCSLKFAI